MGKFKRLLLVGLVSVGWLRAAPGALTVPELPLRFEPIDAGRFAASGVGFTLDLQARENTLIWRSGRSTFSVRTSFPGARQDARMEGVGLLVSRSNYFLGNSPASWRTNVANYAKVRVSGLFTGVDLEFLILQKLHALIPFFTELREGWNTISWCIPALLRMRSRSPWTAHIA